MSGEISFPIKSEQKICCEWLASIIVVVGACLKFLVCSRRCCIFQEIRQDQSIALVLFRIGKVGHEVTSLLPPTSRF